MAKSRLHVDPKVLGRLIREERITKGITQEELARRVGYDQPQFISMIERGVSLPPVKILGKICAELDINTESLAEEFVAAYRKSLLDALCPTT